MANVEISVRRFAADDEPDVLALLGASLGWVPDDLHARFFDWKHRRSPFGHSPAWVGVDDSCGGRVAGFRTFLRWELEDEGGVVRAVRAVDTATHPEYQGRGVFSRLTLAALDDLRADGVAFVFNTPNERSLPGYLKMGWRTVGRLGVAARPRSAGSLLRLVGARTAAQKWSIPTEAGHPAAVALADRAATAALLEAVPVAPGLHTRRTPDYLAWRYGFDPLGYRVVLERDALGDGALVFRLRRRGAALEAAICDLLVPGGDRHVAARLARRVLADSGADYAVRLRPGSPSRFLVLPGQGPRLAWRSLTATEMPSLRRWALTLGDVELL